MIKKIVLTALTCLAATTVFAAKSVTTNTQVLDNINLELKFIKQGALAANDKSLAAGITTFTTSDLIQQLADVGDFAYSKSEKLVLSTVFSNYLVATPGTSQALTNATTNVTSVGGGTNVDYVNSTGTNPFVFVTASATNGYLITNNQVYEIEMAGNGSLVVTNGYPNTSFDTLAGSLILSNNGSSYTPVASINTNSDVFLAPMGAPLGYWMTIIPQVTGGGSGTTNVIIAEYSPAGVATVFTNNAWVGPKVCVYTPKSGSTAASLIDVSQWVSLFPQTDLNGTNFAAYKETGQDLSGGDFTGDNITGQTIYGFQNFRIFTAYPTNGAPATQTNIIFNGDQELVLTNSDTFLLGVGTTTTKLLNLTVGGTAAEKTEVQVIGSEVLPVIGTGYIGGTYTPNPMQTNTVNGVTVVDASYGGFSDYIGATLVGGGTNPYNGNSYVEGYSDAMAEGTIIISYLSAGPEIVPTAP